MLADLELGENGGEPPGETRRASSQQAWRRWIKSGRTRPFSLYLAVSESWHFFFLGGSQKRKQPHLTC